MIKTDGATFKRYLADESPEAWPKDTYYDEDDILVDGENANEQDLDLAKIADTAVVKINYGTVLMGGDSDRMIPMSTHFKRWLKKQTTTTLLVEVAIINADSMRATIKAAGGKVVN